MLKRVITALILLAVTLPILIFSHTIAFPIAAVVLTSFAVFEILRCLGVHRYKSILIPSLIFSVLLSGGTAFLYLEATRAYFDISSYMALCFASCFFYMLYMFATGLVFRGARKFSDIASVLLLVMYITVSFTSITILRQQSGGLFLIFLVFLGPFFTDIFAYFTGMFFGRHKLLPEISPKKTIEGSIGGTVFGALSFLLFGFVVHMLSLHYPILSGGVVLVPSYAVLVANGLLVALFSQVGDLTMSWIKRECGIKDFGKLFPGHGGVLDRFDSVLITAPLILMFSTFTGPLAMFSQAPLL